jgi:putative oxidoreductase
VPGVLYGDAVLHTATFALKPIYDLTGVDIAALLLRVILGITMIAHGYNHIWGGGKIDGTAGWFASMGLKPGQLHAWLGSLTELGAGAMLIIGLLNPLAAAGVVGVMTVALITNHFKNGFFIFRPGEGYEYVLNLSVAALALGALGPGAWSADRYLKIHLNGVTGLVITAVAGIGGALLLLAIFWRPKPKAAEAS